jgi:hypothetical protein
MTLFTVDAHDDAVGIVDFPSLIGIVGTAWRELRLGLAHLGSRRI